MSDKQAVNLFLSNGQLVAAVSVTMQNGKWPLVVEHAGFSYVLANGRYVRANIVEASALGLVR